MFGTLLQNTKDILQYPDDSLTSLGIVALVTKVNCKFFLFSNVLALASVLKDQASKLQPKIQPSGHGLP